MGRSTCKNGKPRSAGRLSVMRSTRRNGRYKRRRPVLPVKGMRAVRRTGYPESENLLLRSSSVGRRQLFIGGLASGAPASIPRWLAAFWFTSTSAASRLNRGSASYSARRRATATWTGRAIGLVFPNSKTINSRLGDDSIWSDAQTRKREFSYPQT
jgi:hypothetical protein